MSTLAASNLDEPPPKIYQSQSPSSFSSLPNDIVLNILSRIPKSYYPILSRVSKSFRIIVRSPEIHKFRSLLGKDSLYICFTDIGDNTCNWFTLSRKEKNPSENLFVPIDFPIIIPSLDSSSSSIIAVGPEIFLIFGSEKSPSSFWIFDSRSGEYRQGPSMQVDLLKRSVGLIGGKIYVIGTYRGYKSQVELFDLKKQTWKSAPKPKEEKRWIGLANVALDKKICVLDYPCITCYDTRDGSCDSFEFANTLWYSTGVCVINNVLYVYYGGLGLMWRDTKLRQWRMVDGLDDLHRIRPIGMAEYYGKLAYMWSDLGLENKQEIWCSMIALDKNKVGIRGTAEPSQLLRVVPRSYSLRKCLSLSA